MRRRAMRSALRSWSWMMPASPFCMKACPPIATSTSLRACATRTSDIETTGWIVQDRVPLRAKEDQHGEEGGRDAGGAAEAGTTGGDLPGPAAQDADRLLPRGAPQGIRPRGQGLLPRQHTRAREAADRDVHAAAAREGLVLPLLPGEGPHGGTGLLLQGRLPAHALQGRRSLWRRPEHERALLQSPPACG